MVFKEIVIPDYKRYYSERLGIAADPAALEGKVYWRGDGVSGPPQLYSHIYNLQLDPRSQAAEECLCSDSFPLTARIADFLAIGKRL